MTVPADAGPDPYILLLTGFPSVTKEVRDALAVSQLQGSAQRSCVTP